METKSIPFVPFPVEKAIEYAHMIGLVGIASGISKMSPQLSLQLYQAESSIDARDYCSIAVFSGIFWALMISGIFVFIGLVAPVPQNFLPIAGMAAGGMGLVSFMYVMMYPKVIVTKRIRELEKHLLFAMRHILIQVKSGIPLFDAMVSVSKAKYGMVSSEFNQAVRKISTGMRDVDALEDMALRNPSLYFRRAIWQVANTIRTGSDIGKTLDVIITNLSNEQRIQVRQYGSQLNPLAFMYMMFGVIMPSLGISLMVTLSSFTGLGIDPLYFWGIIGFLVVFKLNFLGIIKSKRPTVEVYD